MPAPIVQKLTTEQQLVLAIVTQGPEPMSSEDKQAPPLIGRAVEQLNKRNIADVKEAIKGLSEQDLIKLTYYVMLGTKKTTDDPLLSKDLCRFLYETLYRKYIAANTASSAVLINFSGEPPVIPEPFQLIHGVMYSQQMKLNDNSPKKATVAIKDELGFIKDIKRSSPFLASTIESQSLAQMKEPIILSRENEESKPNILTLAQESNGGEKLIEDYEKSLTKLARLYELRTEINSNNKWNKGPRLFFDDTPSDIKVLKHALAQLHTFPNPAQTDKIYDTVQRILLERQDPRKKTILGFRGNKVRDDAITNLYIKYSKDLSEPLDRPKQEVVFKSLDRS